MSYFFNDIDVLDSQKSVLNCHNKISFPSYEQFLPFTELTVSLANEAIERDLGRIDMYSACDFILKRELSPESMLTAIMYINRFKRRKEGNPTKRLASFTSADLFLISMMLASKYLFDDGTEENVVNEEWAEDFGIENNDLNELEIEFLNAIDWRLHVESLEFFKLKQKLSSHLAWKSWNNHEINGSTYRELIIIQSSINVVDLTIEKIIELVIKATICCVVIYVSIIIGVHLMVLTVRACQCPAYQQDNMIFNSHKPFFNQFSLNKTTQPNFGIYNDINESHKHYSTSSYSHVIRSFKFSSTEIGQ